MIPYKDLNAARRFPAVTLLLIAVNTGLFLYVLLMPESAATRFLYTYSVIPYEFKLGHNIASSPGPFPLLTVFSAMFLHGGWFHLLGNMLYLWIFGNNVEDSMGSFRFLTFYFLCGIIATFAQIYGSYTSTIPSLGASGAIAGILAAYLRLYPKARIAVLVPIFFFLRVVILPAWLVLGFWLLLQIASVHLGGGSDQGGIAYFAHLGGFLAGLLLLPLFRKSGRSSRRRR